MLQIEVFLNSKMYISRLMQPGSKILVYVLLQVHDFYMTSFENNLHEEQPGHSMFTEGLV
jgi:hypothetical protein